MTLFDPGPANEPPEKLSYGRKLTQRRRAILEAGRHPVSGYFLLPRTPARTCGTCANLREHRYSGTYFKCALNDTASEATDIRKSWPACTQYQPEGTSDGIHP